MFMLSCHKKGQVLLGVSRRKNWTDVLYLFGRLYRELNEGSRIDDGVDEETESPLPTLSLLSKELYPQQLRTRQRAWSEDRQQQREADMDAERGSSGNRLVLWTFIMLSCHKNLAPTDLHVRWEATTSSSSPLRPQALAAWDGSTVDVRPKILRIKYSGMNVRGHVKEETQSIKDDPN